MPAYGEASFHAHCPCFDRIVYISVTELNEFPKTYTTYKQNGQKGREGGEGGTNEDRRPHLRLEQQGQWQRHFLERKTFWGDR